MRVAAAVMGMLLTAGPSAQERSIEAIAADVHAPNQSIRYRALDELQNRGPSARPAVPALIDRLRECGWQDPEGEVVMEVLGAIGGAATPALPLLVHFVVEADTEHVQAVARSAIERIAASAGADVVPDALVATAQEAEHQWNQPTIHRDPQRMFETMAPARAPFASTIGAHGPAVIPALDQALGSPDPYIRAEAAAWLGDLGPLARASTARIREARRTAPSPWVRYEVDRALARIAARRP